MTLKLKHAQSKGSDVIGISQTLSLQIKLYPWRPGTFNYPKYPQWNATKEAAAI